VTGPAFFADALDEYENVVVYYETKQEGLGARLIDEFEATVALAMEFPDAAAKVAEAPPQYGLRWTLLHSFPVKLVYTVRADALLIVAVFHAHRRPGYWLARLKHLS
jgi:toxin ParE1/3/4